MAKEAVKNAGYDISLGMVILKKICKLFLVGVLFDFLKPHYLSYRNL